MHAHIVKEQQTCIGILDFLELEGFEDRGKHANKNAHYFLRVIPTS